MYKGGQRNAKDGETESWTRGKTDSGTSGEGIISCLHTHTDRKIFIGRWSPQLKEKNTE